MVTLITWRKRAAKICLALFAVSGMSDILQVQQPRQFGGYAALAQVPGQPTTQAEAQTIQNGPLPVLQTGANGTKSSVIHEIRSANERLEMTANSSRIIKLGKEIPRAQVNNKGLVDITPLSKNEIQVFAKKPGVTQLNIWDESDTVHSIDLLIFGDARELEQVLASQYPNSKVKVRPIANSVILSGYASEQEQVSGMVNIAKDYYPNVINNITFGGVQQVSLKVQVMEVSRTKLRQMGVDWSFSTGTDFVTQGVSGLIGATTASSVTANGLDTMRFGLVDGNNSFFGLIQAMRRYDLVKVLAEPVVSVASGRTAHFNAGGEFPVLIPQSLGTVSIQYKAYGTQVDVVPIVLGNGNIRLEVKPRVSEIDNARSVTINGTTVPGLRVREVDTGVEMKAGQTLALAGLVQTRQEASSQGIPWISDLPYLGVPFRKNQDVTNEVELLVMVTPNFVNGVDASEVPPCGPGSGTESPNDCDFYFRGHIEVPSCGPCGVGQDCGNCQSCNYNNYQNGIPGNNYIVPGTTVPGGPTVAPQSREVIPPGSTTRVGPSTSTYSPYAVNRQQQATYQSSVYQPQATGRPALPSTQMQPDVRSAVNTGSDPTRTATRPMTPTPAPATNAGFIGPLGYDTP